MYTESQLHIEEIWVWILRKNNVCASSVYVSVHHSLRMSEHVDNCTKWMTRHRWIIYKYNECQVQIEEMWKLYRNETYVVDTRSFDFVFVGFLRFEEYGQYGNHSQTL